MITEYQYFGSQEQDTNPFEEHEGKWSKNNTHENKRFTSAMSIDSPPMCPHKTDLWWVTLSPFAFIIRLAWSLSLCICYDTVLRYCSRDWGVCYQMASIAITSVFRDTCHQWQTDSQQCSQLYRSDSTQLETKTHTEREKREKRREEWRTYREKLTREGKWGQQLPILHCWKSCKV